MKTEIAVLGKGAAEDEKILSHAAEIIRSGGLAAFPTETVYGLGANALDPEAAKKIYAAKGRPSDNPLIIHISRAEDADKYAYVPDVYQKLAEAFLPGPLTVIMKKRDIIPLTVTGGLDSVAVRLPSHPAARRLIELAGVPIAAPSANISGRPSPTSAAHVIEDMNGRADMIIDGGACQIGLESTIIKLTEDGAVLLRPGGITLEALREVLGNVGVDKAVTGKLAQGEHPLAPGMKYRHYAPRAPLTLIDGTDEEFVEFAGQKLGEQDAVIACDEDCSALLEHGFSADRLLALGGRDDISAQAAALFDRLRLCDTRGFERIFARLPEKSGLSFALYNRIIKAAGYTVINAETGKNE